MSSVCAVVVTHNRLELLRECLGAVAAQTRPPERVLVVDNASTDGTSEAVERDFPGVDVLALGVNGGSSGGFHDGMKNAHGGGAEWLWLMDDDTIPTPGALAELLAAPARLDGAPSPSMLVSKALWTDGRLHPMNIPWPARRDSERMIFGAERGLVPLGSATWVSLLVHRGVIDRHGLPGRHFFIWSDDIDYTGRVLRSEPGYQVPSSVVLHKTKNAHTAISSAPDRFYFHVRNTLFIIRGPGRSRRDKFVFAWLLFSSSADYVIHQPRLASLAAIARGVRDGLRPIRP